MLRREERLVFEAFYKNSPDFAGRSVVCSEGDDPPDIICIDSVGRRIGVELATWLDEQQMAASIERGRLESSYLEAIQSEDVPPPVNSEYIWLSTKSNLHLQKSDAQIFRKEIFRLVEHVDTTWQDNEDHNNPQGIFIRDFSSYPCLDRYLQSLTFIQRATSRPSTGVCWLCFPNSGSAYTPQTMVDALLRIIEKKTGKYLVLHKQQNLDELYLVVYYNKALLHNTPFVAPGFGFREVAGIAASAANKNHGVFQKIFLFNATGQDHQQETIQLWP
jgi:hypothetical protein